MKIEVIISTMLIVQVSASFFDVFQGAVLSVQNSFGKLLSDVVTDVRDTVDCTILAVEHVLSLSEDATARYYEKCATNQTNSSTVSSQVDGAMPKVELSVQFEGKGLPGDIEAKINETLAKALGNYNSNGSLLSVENALAKESEKLVDISDLVKQELAKLSNEVNDDVKNIKLQKSEPSVETILQEIKILENRELNTKNSSEANEIHQIIDKVLGKLDVMEVTEASENVKLDEILKSLENHSNSSFKDLRQQFEEWKEEESRHLDEIENKMREHEELSKHPEHVDNGKYNYTQPVQLNTDTGDTKVNESALLSTVATSKKEPNENLTKAFLYETTPLNKENTTVNSIVTTQEISSQQPGTEVIKIVAQAINSSAPEKNESLTLSSNLTTPNTLDEKYTNDTTSAIEPIVPVENNATKNEDMTMPSNVSLNALNEIMIASTLSPAKENGSLTTVIHTAETTTVSGKNRLTFLTQKEFATIPESLTASSTVSTMTENAAANESTSPFISNTTKQNQTTMNLDITTLSLKDIIPSTLYTVIDSRPVSKNIQPAENSTVAQNEQTSSTTTLPTLNELNDTVSTSLRTTENNFISEVNHAVESTTMSENVKLVLQTTNVPAITLKNVTTTSPHSTTIANTPVIDLIRPSEENMTAENSNATNLNLSEPITPISKNIVTTSPVIDTIRSVEGNVTAENSKATNLNSNKLAVTTISKDIVTTSPVIETIRPFEGNITAENSNVTNLNLSEPITPISKDIVTTSPVIDTIRPVEGNVTAENSKATNFNSNEFAVTTISKDIVTTSPVIDTIRPFEGNMTAKNSNVTNLNLSELAITPISKDIVTTSSTIKDSTPVFENISAAENSVGTKFQETSLSTNLPGLNTSNGMVITGTTLPSTQNTSIGEETHIENITFSMINESIFLTTNVPETILKTPLTTTENIDVNQTEHVESNTTVNHDEVINKSIKEPIPTTDPKDVVATTASSTIMDTTPLSENVRLMDSYIDAEVTAMDISSHTMTTEKSKSTIITHPIENTVVASEKDNALLDTNEPTTTPKQLNHNVSKDIVTSTSYPIPESTPITGSLPLKITTVETNKETYTSGEHTTISNNLDNNVTTDTVITRTSLSTLMDEVNNIVESTTASLSVEKILDTHKYDNAESTTATRQENDVTIIQPTTTLNVLLDENQNDSVMASTLYPAIKSTEESKVMSSVENTTANNEESTILSSAPLSTPLNQQSYGTSQAFVKALDKNDAATTSSPVVISGSTNDNIYAIDSLLGHGNEESSTLAVNELTTSKSLEDHYEIATTIPSAITKRDIASTYMSTTLKILLTPIPSERTSVRENIPVLDTPIPAKDWSTSDQNRMRPYVYSRPRYTSNEALRNVNDLNYYDVSHTVPPGKAGIPPRIFNRKPVNERLPYKSFGAIKEPFPIIRSGYDSITPNYRNPPKLMSNQIIPNAFTIKPIIHNESERDRETFDYMESIRDKLLDKDLLAKIKEAEAPLLPYQHSNNPVRPIPQQLVNYKNPSYMPPTRAGRPSYSYNNREPIGDIYRGPRSFTTNKPPRANSYGGPVQDYGGFFETPSKDTEEHQRALREARELIQNGNRSDRIMNSILQKKAGSTRSLFKNRGLLNSGR